MRFQFYTLEAGSCALPELREIAGSEIECRHEESLAAVAAQFHRLVAEKPSLSNVVVISPTLGDPPGMVIAAELVQSLPARTREQQGKPARQLIWTINQTTGIG